MQKIMGIFLVVMMISGIFSCGGGGSDPAPINAKYIDPLDGSLSGEGSESSPYKSFSQVTFEAGTSYLIKRDTVLEEQITVNASGTASAPIVIGAYGTGADPVIDGSNVTVLWNNEGSGVYSNTLISHGNVCEFIAGKWEILTFKSSGTPASGEYTIDSTGKVQVYGDPATRSLRLSTRYYGINGTSVSYITIKDLHIRQASLHGIQFEDSDHITVQNCNIEMCGGGYIASIIQAGNGVEFGNSSSYCTVTGCTVSQIFDSGVTCQTYDSNQAGSYFTFSNNNIEKCGFAGVEIAVLAGSGNTNSSINNVTIRENDIGYCGTGFSGVRGGNEGRGIKIAADNGAGTMSGVSVEQCVIDTCEGEGIYINGENGLVNIARCMVTGNKRDGINLEDAGHTTLGLKVVSSIIKDNIDEGLKYNATAGAGLEIYNCTFYNNTFINVSLGVVTGKFRMKNTVVYTASACHLFSGSDLSSISEIDYNCYYSEHANMIGWGGSAYSTLALFQAGTVFDDNSKASDPSFDAYFKPGSADCRGNGTVISGVTADYYGATFRNPPTIGAVEY